MGRPERRNAREWYVDVKMSAVEDTAASSQCAAVNPQQLEPVAPATPSSRPHNSFRALYKSSPAAAATAPFAPASEQVTSVKAANADTDSKGKIAELEAALTALDATCGEYSAALAAAEQAFEEQDAALEDTRAELASVTDTMAGGVGGSTVSELQTALQAAETANAERCRQWDGRSAEQDAKVLALETKVAELEGQLTAKRWSLSFYKLVKDGELLQKMDTDGNIVNAKDSELSQAMDTDGENQLFGTEVEEHLRQMEFKITDLESEVLATRSLSSTHAATSNSLKTKVAELETQLDNANLTYEKMVAVSTQNMNALRDVSSQNMKALSEEMKTEIAELEAQVIATERESQTHAAMCDSLKTKVADLEAQLEKVEAANAENCAAVLNTEAKVAELEAALAAAETEAARKGAILSKTKAQLASTRKEVLGSQHSQEAKMTQLQTALTAAWTATAQKETILSNTNAQLVTTKEEASSAARHAQAKIEELEGALAAAQAAIAARMEELATTHKMEKATTHRRVQQMNALCTQLTVASPPESTSKRLLPVMAARMTSVTYLRARIKQLELNGARKPTGSEQDKRELKELTHQLMLQSKLRRDDLARIRSGVTWGDESNGASTPRETLPWYTGDLGRQRRVSMVDPLLAMEPCAWARLVSVSTPEGDRYPPLATNSPK